MIPDTVKTRGRNKLFKDENGEIAIVTYREQGITKTACFRGPDCNWRAKQKCRRLRAMGVNILSVSHGGMQ